MAAGYACRRNGASGQSAGDNPRAVSYSIGMGDLRLSLRLHRICAMWLLAAALLMKVAVPAGYMPVISGGSIVLELCSGFGPEKMAMAMPGKGDHRGPIEQQDKDGTGCGFSGHAPAAMAAVDPILRFAAIAPVIDSLFRMPVFWSIHWISFLRPPLRGPPPVA